MLRAKPAVLMTSYHTRDFVEKEKVTLLIGLKTSFSLSASAVNSATGVQDTCKLQFFHDSRHFAVIHQRKGLM